MTPAARALRRALPSHRDWRRFVRQGQALAGALVAAAVLLAVAVAVVAAVGGGGPSFGMSKLTRADMLEADRAAPAQAAGRETAVALKT
jgi:hypothetical protein